MDILRFCVFVLFAAVRAQDYHVFPGMGMISIIERVTGCDLAILQSNWVVRREGEAVSLNCKPKNCNNVNLRLQWVDNHNQSVPEVQSFSGINGAQYWMRGTLRLDIGALEPRHQGSYYCKAIYGSRVLQKTVYLQIIRMLPPTTPEPTTVTTVPTTASATTPPSTTTSAATTTSSTLTTTSAADHAQNSTTTSSAADTTTTTTPLLSSTTSVTTPHATVAADESNVAGAVIATEFPNPRNGIPTADNMNESSRTDLTTAEAVTGFPGTSTISPTDVSSSSTGSTSRSAEISALTSVDSEVGPQQAGSVLDNPSTSPPVNDGVTDLAPRPVLTADSSSSEVGMPAQNSSIVNLPRPAEELIETTEEDEADETPSNTVHRYSNGVEIGIGLLPTLDDMSVMKKRRKRASNNLGRNTTYTNETFIFDEGLYPKCSGFGPKAIATIAILGAVCLILLYSFILVLCFPRFRKRGTVVVEKSEKQMEEGCVEGIEIREKPDDSGSEQNGRISRAEDTLEMADVTRPEAEENQEKDKLDNQHAEDDNSEATTRQETESKVTEPDRTTPEPEETETTAVVVETPKYTPVVLPMSPVEEQLEAPKHEEVDVKEVEEPVKETPQEEEREAEPHVTAPPEPEPRPEADSSQDFPVFDDPEPQEMAVRESLVNGASVELEDKSVDTVELESQDMDDPSISQDDSSDFESESQPLRRMTPPPVFSTEPPALDSEVNDARLSNGFDEPETGEQHIQAPPRDEMTKSIEDLPPPPPIPAHLTPPPPPPHANKVQDPSMEAPDVVSSNVTAV